MRWQLMTTPDVDYIELYHQVAEERFSLRNDLRDERNKKEDAYRCLNRVANRLRALPDPDKFLKASIEDIDKFFKGLEEQI